MKPMIILAASMFFMTVAGVHAEATCESVRTDLTGVNIYGRHTVKQLSQAAETGDCNAAAYLSRRAKDVQGFLQTNCPAEKGLRETAAGMVALAQDTLQTPGCKD